MENVPSNNEASSGTSALSAGLGVWVPMGERVPEPDTVCAVWVRYSRDTKGHPTVDTWALQHEDPLGMGGPTIPTGYGWDDNYVEDVLYWMALPAKPDESIDQRWEETPNAKSQAPDAALSRQVACTDGLCGNGSKVGAGDTAAEIEPARDIHAELTLAAFHREVAK